MEGLASVPRAKARAFVGLREGFACPTSQMRKAVVVLGFTSVPSWRNSSSPAGRSYAAHTADGRPLASCIPLRAQ